MTALTHPGGNLTGFINLEAGWACRCSAWRAPEASEVFSDAHPYRCTRFEIQQLGSFRLQVVEKQHRVSFVG
jgi:hypothetical protein